MSIHNLKEPVTVEDVAIEEMKFNRGPSKKDIQDIETEFKDILENDDVSADDSRFTEQEIQQINVIWKFISKNTRGKKQDKEMKELDALTADEYLSLHDKDHVEKEDDENEVEEVSFDNLNNYEEAGLYYNEN